MVRIGIVGSDNSHAEAFSKICNDETHELYVKDAEVVSIFGLDPERTQEVATNGKIPTIVETPDEMIGNVDLVLVVYRHGGLHRQYAEPFLRAGVPAFVDKPMSISPQDAKALLDAADKNNTLLTSFSTLRYAKDMRAFIDEAKAGGPIHMATMSGPADRQSEYGGLPFYGVHIAEMLQELVGTGVHSVHAVQNNQSIVATVTYYDDVIATLSFLGNTNYVFHMGSFGEKGHVARPLDAGSCYRDGLDVVLKMLETGEAPLNREQLLEPVKVMTAIDQSLITGKSVDISII
jgi:predicted dehydrogenase